MPNKKRSTKTRRAALIVEARAGLIPASDDIEDEVRSRMDRTARIGRIVKVYARLLEHGSENLAISDNLADLRHYCNGKRLAFRELDTAACERYQEEEAQSRMSGLQPN